MRDPRSLIALAGLLHVACGTTSLKNTPPPDQPVPATEPRGAVAARVDLIPARDCEEAFDLAVYAQRAIELVAWDEDVGTCRNRRIDVQYLSARISRDEVIETVRRHAERATILPAKGSKDDEAK